MLEGQTLENPESFQSPITYVNSLADLERVTKSLLWKELIGLSIVVES
jgi:hypothetical protein